MGLKKRKGSINIYFLNIIMIFIFISILIIFYTFFQINFITNIIKKDVHYICQNIFKDIDKDSLEYNNIELDLEKSKNIIEYLINDNYKSYNIKVNSLKYDGNYLNIILYFKVEPIVLKNKIDNLRIKISERVKFKNIEGVQ